jgi:DNA-binding LytR/AlgR family response regulator
VKKINCLIADDEQLARTVMESYVTSLSSLHLVKVVNSAIDVYEVLKTEQIDLLFLDVEMPKLSGLELLRTLKNPPAVILTTAHRNFAVEGYELNVIDYLLKPISFERFLKAISKFENLKTPAPVEASGIQVVAKDEKLAFIYVRVDKKMVRVNLNEILFIEALKDYVKIYSVGKELITYQTLTYFEEKLSSDYFLRIHRSFIVSILHINAYSAIEIEIGKRILPIGSFYSKEVQRKLGEHV